MRIPRIPEQYIPRPIKQLLRLIKIFGVMTKHVYNHFAERYGLRVLLRKRHPLEFDYEYPTLNIYQRFRFLLEDLGPSFVKLGQLLSTRADILPRELIDELTKLQEEVTPFSYEGIERQIMKNFRAPVEEIFLDFEKEPIASASIGQVHKAVLKTGEEVIVKVQRIGVRRDVEADISNMMTLARLAERYIKFARTYNAVQRVIEFARFIREEMDYTIEADHCDRFRDNFADDESVYIPKIYWELTNPKILVMEYIEGIRVIEQKKMEEAGLDKKTIARTVGSAFMKMILLDGYFHADPHPGNIFIFDNDHIGLIDFGIVGRIGKEIKGYIANYFLAIINQDASALIDSLSRVYEVPRDADLKSLKRDAGMLLMKYYGTKLGRVNIQDFVREIFSLVSKYNIIVPGEYTLFDKTFVTLDGIIRRLDPDIDLIKEAAPYATTLLREQFSLKEIGMTLAKDALEIREIFSNLPHLINKLTAKLDEGELKFRVEDQRLAQEMEEVSSKIEKIGSRLPLSIIITSLILGGALISLRGNEPHFIWGLTLSRIFFYSAAFLGFFFFISLLRRKKKR